MRKLSTYVIFFFAMLLSAQNGTKQWQKEIDQQVWKPFKVAFESLDAEALNGTYAEDVLRVTPNGIDTENAFRAKNVARFSENKSKGITISLDFWFDSRHTNASTSYEVGFYRIAFTSQEGNTDFVYGQFHIVLKKLDGTWKITQDWDTTTINGKVIDADDFKMKDPFKI